MAAALLSLVPSGDVFRTAARAIKHWARCRGVYGNVVGYPGGVAWAIMTARICQLYPNADASVVFIRFFTIYARWKWPQPVLLRQIQEGNGALKVSEDHFLQDNVLSFIFSFFQVWNPAMQLKDRRDLMPVITPAHPAMCSTYNITKSNKFKISQEIDRAVEESRIFVTTKKCRIHQQAHFLFLFHNVLSSLSLSLSTGYCENGS